MLFTASTILDTTANVDHFVRANLANGVDHMVVFLDAPGAEGQAEVHELLSASPHVTVVPTDRAWWRGDRPRGLNVRQRVNANLLLEALAAQPGASWLFHLDGDEVFHGDRTVLDALPSDVDAAWLTPLEAVSRPDPDERPTLFKRLLDDSELNLLRVLGAVERASNSDYFHGHVLGKSGVRPGSGLRLTLHEAVDAEGRLAPRAEDPRLRVLHYDAVSGAEFVRKWTAMLGAGPARFRPDRAPVAEALRALVGRDLEPAVAERYLRRIYEATTQDDVTTLSELGLLVHVDPARGTHSPTALPEPEAGALLERIHGLATEPMRRFDAQKARRPDPEPEPRSLLGRAVSRRRGAPSR